MTAEVARSAVVTGAGMGIGGIGRAIAARLAQAGVSTLLADADPRVEEAAEEVRKTLRKEGDVPKISHFVGDLSEETVADALSSEKSTFSSMPQAAASFARFWNMMPSR